MRVVCLLAIAVAGLVCGWLWNQAETYVVAASVADPHSGVAWFRGALALTLTAITSLAVIVHHADREKDR